jgi:hypothetical protein
MKSVLAFSTTQTFQLSVAAATVRRLYEDSDQDYSFASSDIQFDLTDAKNVYDLVCADQEVFIVIMDGNDEKFRGTLQHEGATYDPETEIYSINALHISKKIFAGLEIPYPFGEFPATMNFDLNQLRNMTGCDIAIDAQTFAPFVLEGNPLPAKALSTQYQIRDFLIDLAKYHRAIIHVADALTPGGQNQIMFDSKKAMGSVIHQGYDDLIAAYKEDSRNAQFDGVLFPCYLRMIYNGGGSYSYDKTAISFATYTRSGITMQCSFAREDTLAIRTGLQDARSDVTLQFLMKGNAVTLPDNCLDLRVPKGTYGETFPGVFPFVSLPTFIWSVDSNAWQGESPDQYCEREYGLLMHPFKEITVQYSDTLPVNPAETIVVRGMNLPMAEVDDDLVDESTTIVGRLYS